MKKIMMALVASTMLAGFSAPTFAAFNPANIDESSHSANIYKVIDKKIAKGKTSGVQGMFAWAEVDGEVYSVALRELRKYANPGKRFSEIVGEQVQITLIERAEAQVAEMKRAIVEASIEMIDITDPVELERVNTEIAAVQGMIDVFNADIATAIATANGAADREITRLNGQAQEARNALPALEAALAEVQLHNSINAANALVRSVVSMTDGVASYSLEFAGSIPTEFTGDANAARDNLVTPLDVAARGTVEVSVDGVYTDGAIFSYMIGTTEFIGAITPDGNVQSFQVGGNVNLADAAATKAHLIEQWNRPASSAGAGTGAAGQGLGLSEGPNGFRLSAETPIVNIGTLTVRGDITVSGANLAADAIAAYNTVTATDITYTTLGGRNLSVELSLVDVFAINRAITEAFEDGYGDGYEDGFEDGYVDGFGAGVTYATSN